MTLQQLSYFQHVARSGSFTRAARACFVSQTAISRQINALEEELHLTLIERDTTHVALTPAGEVFYKEVCAILLHLEQAVAQAQSIAQAQDAHLTLGIPTILEQHTIGPILRRYHALHPQVKLTTVSGTRQQLVRQLVDREIDLMVALDFDLPSLEGLDAQVLQRTQAAWLLPLSHPLAEEPSIAPTELQDETLILTQEDSDCSTEELLRQYYSQLGMKGNPTLHTRTVEELFLLTSCGIGIGLLPVVSANWLLPDLRVVPIDGPAWDLQFLLISRREHSRRSVQAMFELIRSIETPAELR